MQSVWILLILTTLLPSGRILWRYKMQATISDAVNEYTVNVGRECLDDQWILSPYDSWELNPFYSGPNQRHPEAYYPEED